MTLESFWVRTEETALRQGDHLPGCLVPVFGPDFAAAGTHEVTADEYDLIVVTQSCDLEQGKVRLVAACPIYPISDFEAVNPGFTKKGRWNEVLKGRIEGLHLLASPANPESNREALVVDFREIYSLPLPYLISRTASSASAGACGRPIWSTSPRHSPGSLCASACRPQFHRSLDPLGRHGVAAFSCEHARPADGDLIGSVLSMSARSIPLSGEVIRFCLSARVRARAISTGKTSGRGVYGYRQRSPREACGPCPRGPRPGPT
jgi:hypothetical protein